MDEEICESKYKWCHCLNKGSSRYWNSMMMLSMWIQILVTLEKQVFDSGSIPSLLNKHSQCLSDTVMKGFKPVFASVVQEFAVFDRCFSSIHGSTSHVKKQLAKGRVPTKNHIWFTSWEWIGLWYLFSEMFFYRNLRKLKYIFKFHQFDLKDAWNGNLPSLSVIEPRYFMM